MKRKGFTLLELVVVIIIIGVLAGLALPRLILSIELSKAAEAYGVISSIRSALERCFVANNGSYGNCDIDTLDIDDPNKQPARHFNYTMLWFVTSDGGEELDIIAIRNTYDCHGNCAGQLRFVVEDNLTHPDVAYYQGYGIYSRLH